LFLESSKLHKQMMQHSRRIILFQKALLFTQAKCGASFSGYRILDSSLSDHYFVLENFFCWQVGSKAQDILMEDTLIPDIFMSPYISTWIMVSIHQSIKKNMMFCAWFSLHHFDVFLIQLLGLSLRPSRRIGKAIGTIIGWTWDFAGKFHQNRRPTNLTHIFPLIFQVPSGFFCCCKLWEWQNSQVTRKNPNIPKI